MRRYLPRLVLTGALLSPVTLYALGLGEIRLNSALNQPFDADIELISPTAEELATLKVGLASNDLFDRYGLDRPAFLSDFEFSVTRGRDGRASIKVTSRRSVTEPFVTLLVEANYGRGRLLREYTVLLDPPVFMPSQPEAQAPVAAPQSGARTEGRIERVPEPARPTPVPAPEPAPSAEPVVRETPAAAPASVALGGTYTVERNDTLWRIASRMQPGAGPRVINQTMIAIFRANPEAFDGNINRLKAGSILRLPDQPEIDAISTTEAAAEVRRQQEEWSGAVRTAVAEEAGRLRLVPPEEAPTAPAPTSATETAATGTQAGTGAPAPAVEDRRLEITSPELAAAQQQVSEAPVEAEPVAEAPVEPADIEAEPAAEPVEAEAPPVAAQPRRATRPPVAQTEPEVGPSLVDRLLDFWWVLVVLGLLVIGALAVVKRRREHSDLDDLDTSSTVDFEPRALRTRQREPVAADDFDEPEQEASAPAPVTVRREEAAPPRPVEVTEAPAPVAKSIEDTLSSETAVRFDQQDALAEADFHMAYGLYDQAADLVKIAIDREPGRRDLKLKLLEIYFVWGNKDAFLETARDLHATRDQAPAGEWDKILIMGKQIAADDPMFKGEGGPVDLVDVNLEGGENRVDVDLFAEPEDLSSKSGLDLQFATGERPGGSDLDFLLDDEKPAHEEEPTREMLDPLARTQETPTIESPALDTSAATVREKIDMELFAKNSTDQTAELSLDDLGLDVDALEATGSLEETAALQQDDLNATMERPLRDDEMTQLAPSIGPLDRTMEAPRAEAFDIESTGTIYIDQVDLSPGDTVEQPRPDVDATAALKRLDVDLDRIGGEDAQAGETVHQPAGADVDAARFSDDVFGTDRTAEFPKVDLDVGEPLPGEDREPTNKVVTAEMELSELEPVTMSEVGTKLDLARAYMDMGDPDGARSILEEVVQEGNSSQKQEAMRLLESIR
ncbi:MAG TPA: FimV/HubP family polar landmark protein [Steroidobacteraceae bacterium]